MMLSRVVFLRFVLLLSTWWVLPLRAHGPGLSTAKAVLKSDGIDLALALAPADAKSLLAQFAGRGGAAPSSKVAESSSEYEALASDLLVIWVNGKAAIPQSQRVEVVSGDAVVFHFSYLWESGPLSFDYEARSLRSSPSTHREYFEVFSPAGTRLFEKMLSAQEARCTVAVGPVPMQADSANADAPRSFGSFFVLGVEHIWTGYDHLLFLFGLLVVCQSFRSIALIVTCFTLAHSLTLGLVTVGLLGISGNWIEPAIAASIIYVGLENLMRRGGEPRGRWLLTFCFGLIHGFGFASVLKDLGVGAGGLGVAVPLLSFNLGVEAGQLVVAALVLPVVWRLRRFEGFRTWGVAGLSGVIVLAGAFWFSQRV